MHRTHCTRLHVELRDRRTNRHAAHIGNNSLHLRHLMQPRNCRRRNGSNSKHRQKLLQRNTSEWPTEGLGAGWLTRATPKNLPEDLTVGTESTWSLEEATHTQTHVKAPTYVKKYCCSTTHFHRCLQAANVGHLNPDALFFCKHIQSYANRSVVQ